VSSCWLRRQLLCSDDASERACSGTGLSGMALPEPVLPEDGLPGRERTRRGSSGLAGGAVNQSPSPGAGGAG
jgi:hypothetical protein